jgi:hypothetical protein
MGVVAKLIWSYVSDFLGYEMGTVYISVDLNVGKMKV